jgi:hypothetical protein
MKARMGVAAVWLTAMAGAGVSRTCGFEVVRFRSKAVMTSREVAAPLVEAQSTMGWKGELEDAGDFSTQAKLGGGHHSTPDARECEYT